MSNTNNGGAAFPHVFVVDGPASDPVTGTEVPDGRKHGHYFPGMTLRDYFAAAALPAVVTWAFNSGIALKLSDAATEKLIGDGAYQCADSMLAARAAAEA